jgi:excisionase family DNA binding protein
MSLKGFLTTKEVAEKLGVSVGRVQQFIAEGRLPATKVGQTNLVKESDLKLVEDRKTGRPPKSKKDNSG